MENRIPQFLLRGVDHQRNEYGKGRRCHSAFLDKGLLGLSRVLKDTYVQWDLSSREGLFQRLDPRLKLLFLAFFAVAVSLKRDITSEVVIVFILLILNVLSRLQLISLYSRVLALGLVFGVILSLPAACNIIVPGTIVLPFITLDKSHDVLFYHIPKTIGLTREGLHLVALLFLRVVNSLTICFLVLFTTPFPDLAKALKLFRVPDVVIMIMTLFHKYLFILSCSLEKMHLAMKSRVVSALLRRDARVWATGRMAYIYKRSHQTCEEVFQAMLSRGFTSEVRLAGPHRFSGVDRIVGAVLMAVWAVIILF